MVKSILFATQVYWSSLFILPKGVIKNMEQVLRWKGVDASKGGCKVAWGILCLPRKEGGLGIKKKYWGLESGRNDKTHLASLLGF